MDDLKLDGEIVKKALRFYLIHNRHEFCGCVGCCDIRVRLFPHAFHLYPPDREPSEAHKVVTMVGALGQLRLAWADFLEAFAAALDDKARRIRRHYGDPL